MVEISESRQRDKTYKINELQAKNPSTQEQQDHFLQNERRITALVIYQMTDLGGIPNMLLVYDSANMFE